MVSVWAGGMVDWGVALVWAVAGLWLPRGGVAQHWAGEPAGWSMSIGVAVGGLADVAVAYEWGAVDLLTTTSGGGSGRVRVHGSGGGSLGTFGGCIYKSTGGVQESGFLSGAFFVRPL